MCATRRELVNAAHTARQPATTSATFSPVPLLGGQIEPPEIARIDQRQFLARLTIERELRSDDLTPELWAARRKQLQMKLLSLVQWFRSRECRKVGLYKNFGWHGANQPCGFCDRCEGAK